MSTTFAASATLNVLLNTRLTRTDELATAFADAEPRVSHTLAHGIASGQIDTIIPLTRNIDGADSSIIGLRDDSMTDPLTDPYQIPKTLESLKILLIKNRGDSSLDVTASSIAAFGSFKVPAGGCFLWTSPNDGFELVNGATLEITNNDSVETQSVDLFIAGVALVV